MTVTRLNYQKYGNNNFRRNCIYVCKVHIYLLTCQNEEEDVRGNFRIKEENCMFYIERNLPILVVIVVIAMHFMKYSVLAFHDKELSHALLLFTRTYRNNCKWGSGAVVVVHVALCVCVCVCTGKIELYKRKLPFYKIFFPIYFKYLHSYTHTHAYSSCIFDSGCYFILVCICSM